MESSNPLANQTARQAAVSKSYSSALIGIEAIPVEVEALLVGALRRFSIVGLPDGVVREAKERVRCAVENSSFNFPEGEVVVSLAPAALPKAGSGFDLSIALAVLGAGGQLDRERLRCYMVLGELALDGRVKAVAGVVAALCAVAKRARFELIIPHGCAAQAGLVPGIRVYPVRTLAEAVAFINGTFSITPIEPADPTESARCFGPDFSDVIGQSAAKRALEVAASGGHNLVMVGPPGAGKSMLASRLPSILPPLGRAEALEVTRIASCAGRTTALGHRAPFRAPHHTTSAAALLGGSSGPGEVTFAHRGVLFLDEFTEIRRDAVEALRQPLEERRVRVARSNLRVEYPADFMFVAAMNPCPCGKRGSANLECRCPAGVVDRYFAKLSGPILDRIDLQLWIPAVPLKELTSGAPPEDPTPAMLRRVIAARQLQGVRFGSGARLNAHITQKEFPTYCGLGSQARDYLERAGEKLQLSARSHGRVLRVARTIADLEGESQIALAHLAEALNYRLSLIC